MNKILNVNTLRISVAALLCSFASISKAQNLEIGLRYEPEFSTLMNKNDANAGPELNYASHYTYFNFGIGGVYNLSNNVGLAVDILFSREGQNFNGNFEGKTADPATYAAVVSTQAFLNNFIITGDYVALAELNYVKLPLMLSLTTDNTRPLFFTVLVGPQINFLYNVAQEVNHTDYNYPNSNITPFGLYKPITIDGVLALGIGINLTSHVILSARARFDYGFGDAENKDAMVSYYGAAPVHFYSSDREITHTATAGLLIGLDFKI
jgi:hypothetical protein